MFGIICFTIAMMMIALIVGLSFLLLMESGINLNAGRNSGGILMGIWRLEHSEDKPELPHGNQL